MMPMNQSMMPYFLQMMQGQGGGMPSMQNNAPSIPTPQLGQSNIAPVPQMQPIQQRPNGGALGQGVQGMQNIQSIYNMGNKAYNGMFGSSPQMPNAMSGVAGNNISGAPSNNIGGNPAGSYQPSSANPNMGFDPNASGAQPGIYSQMKNDMGMSQPGFDSQSGSGLSGANAPGSATSMGSLNGAYQPNSLTGVRGSQLGGSGAIFNGTAGEGAGSAYGMAGEGASAADASSSTAATDAASGAEDSYAEQMYNWLYDLL